MWYIYTKEFYSASKDNVIINIIGKWIEPENIILNEVTQTKKDIMVCMHLKVDISHKRHNNQAIIKRPKEIK